VKLGFLIEVHGEASRWMKTATSQENIILLVGDMCLFQVYSGLKPIKYLKLVVFGSK
jgi:hypothetical protein